MPSPGAVWPAMVIEDLFSTNLLFNWMVPEIPNRIVRGPVAERRPSRKEPGPASFRFVTWNTYPPRPPAAKRPKPSAPGKASGFSADPASAPASKRAPQTAKARVWRIGFEQGNVTVEVGTGPICAALAHRSISKAGGRRGEFMKHSKGARTALSAGFKAMPPGHRADRAVRAPS